MQTKLIVYACPTGTLAAQLDAYFLRARQKFGHNPAHDYMPHITLTGFFSESASAVPYYIQWLENAHTQAQATRPDSPVTVLNMLLNEKFHGLEIESPWLKGLIQLFRVQADSPTRPEAIRPKDWLHLSLAYGFAAEEDAPLRVLARRLVDPRAPAGWELRLYAHNPEPDEQDSRPVRGGWEQSWTCHATWSL